MAIIKRVRGDNYDLEIEITDNSGNPIDLTGTTVFFTVKRNYNEPDGSALISIDVTTHTDPVNGITSIPLTSSQTDIEGEFVYDVKILNGSELTSIESDSIIFLPHVTQRTS